jgi:hypothetical protein
MVETLPEKTVPEIENIDANDAASYKSAVKTTYQGSDSKNKEPFTLIVGYTSHLAVKLRVGNYHK